MPAPLIGDDLTRRAARRRAVLAAAARVDAPAGRRPWSAEPAHAGWPAAARRMSSRRTGRRLRRTIPPPPRELPATPTGCPPRRRAGPEGCEPGAVRVAALAAAALVVTPAAGPGRRGHRRAAAGAGRAGAPATRARSRSCARVDRVDGRPVDSRGALRGARRRAPGAAARRSPPARFAGAGGRRPAGAGAGDPRRAALPRLGVPGPFHGAPAAELGHLLRPAQPGVRWLERAAFPGPRVVVWLVLAALVGAGAAVVARRALTRRLGAPRRRPPRLARGRATTRTARAAGGRRPRRPATSRPRCGCASAPGCCGSTRAAAIEFRPSITTHEVRRTLRSDDFDALPRRSTTWSTAAAPPDGDDLAAARERWPEVVAGG